MAGLEVTKGGHHVDPPPPLCKKAAPSCVSSAACAKSKPCARRLRHPRRRQAKWWVAQALIGAHEVVCFQETCGCAGGLGTLPTHVWFGAFQALSSVIDGSAGGGSVIGVHRHLITPLPHIEQFVVERGRAHIVRCLESASADGVEFHNVHLELAASFEVLRRVVDAVGARALVAPRCIAFLHGDSYFVHAGDPRVDLRRLDAVATPGRLDAHFERRLCSLVELEQVAYARRHLVDGIPVLSRIDRVYARLLPSDLGGMNVLSQAVGDVSSECSHCREAQAISVASAPLSRRRSAGPTPSPARLLLAQLPCGGDVFERLALAMDSLRCVAANAMAELVAGRSLLASVAAQAGLRTFRASRRRDAASVRRACIAKPDVAPSSPWMGVTVRSRGGGPSR